MLGGGGGNRSETKEAPGSQNPLSVRSPQPDRPVAFLGHISIKYLITSKCAETYERSGTQRGSAAAAHPPAPSGARRRICIAQTEQGRYLLSGVTRGETRPPPSLNNIAHAAQPSGTEKVGVKFVQKFHPPDREPPNAPIQ